MCATAAPRCASRSIRCWSHAAIDAVGIDFYPPIADWRDGADHADLAEARSLYDLDYLRARVAGGRGLRLVLRERGRPARADAHADHRRRLRQALGVPGQGPGRLVVEPAYRAGRRARDCRDRVVAAREADLADRDRRSGGRQGCQRAERLSRSEIVGIRRSRRSRAAAATTSSRSRALEAILSRFDPALARPSGRRTTRSRLSTAGAWSTPGTCSSGPGTRGLSRPFRTSISSGPIGELGDRPLDHRPARGHARRSPHRRRPRRFRPRAGGAARRRLPRRLCDRPPDVGARGARAAGAAVRHRRRRDRRRARLAAAAGDGPRPPSPPTTSSRPAASRCCASCGRRKPSSRSRSRSASPTARRNIAGPPSHRAALPGQAGARRAPMPPIVTRRAEAQRLADAWLQDLWAGRETAEFELRPAPSRGRARRHARPADRGRSAAPSCGPHRRRSARRIATRAVEPSVFDAAAGEGTKPVRRPPLVAGAPEPIVLDLPVARGEPTVLQYLAVAADPWPGAVAIWRANDAELRVRPDRSTCRRSSGARSGRSRPARSGAGTRRAPSMSRSRAGRSPRSRTRRRLAARTCSPSRAPICAGRSSPPLARS